MADDTTTTTNTDFHELPRYEIVNLPGMRKCTMSWAGTFDACKAKSDSIFVGCFSDVGDEGTKVCFCYSQLTRRPGDRAEFTATWVLLTMVDYWSVDYAEISKPIKTWNADADVEVKPHLDLITRWEALRTTDPAAYASYQYDATDSSKVLDGATRQLAEMIYKWQISSYTIHRPICTRTSVNIGLPTDIGKNLDKQVAPDEPDGWEPAGSSATDVSSSKAPARIAALAKVWVKTSDRATPNNDGTYTRVEQWTGMDSVNSDLYPAAAQ